MNQILLHCCCAPCSLSCIDPLREEGLEPVAFWYNPVSYTHLDMYKRQQQNHAAAEHPEKHQRNFPPPEANQAGRLQPPAPPGI